MNAEINIKHVKENIKSKRTQNALGILKNRQIVESEKIENLEKEISTLSQSLNNQNQLNLTLQKESLKLQDEIEKYKELYNIVKNSRDLIQKQFQQYKNKYTIDISKLNEYNEIELKLKEDINSKEKHYTQIINSNEQKYALAIIQYKQKVELVENKLNELQTQHNETIHKLSKVNEEYSLLKVQYENVNNEKKEILLLNTKLLNENNRYKKQIQTLKEELSNKKLNSNMEQSDFDKIIQQLKKDHEEQKIIIESTHREEIDHLKFTHNLSYNQTKLKLEEAISNLKIELSLTKKQLNSLKQTNPLPENIPSRSHNKSHTTQPPSHQTNISIEEQKTPRPKHTSNTIIVHSKCKSDLYFNKKTKPKINKSFFYGSSSSQNMINVSSNKAKKNAQTYESKNKEKSTTSSKLHHQRNYGGFFANEESYKTNSKHFTSSLPKLTPNKTINNFPL